MFSFGDACIVALALAFIVWLLRRLWPDRFASELELILRRAQREGTKPTVVVHTPDETRWPYPAGAGPVVDHEPDHIPGAGGPEDLLRKPHVGRAHLHEDGAFAGSLKDKGDPAPSTSFKPRGFA